MHKLVIYLKDHPGMGITTSLLGFMQSFIETSTPYLQYTALMLAVAIGVLTFIAKYKDLKEKYKNNKKD